MSFPESAVPASRSLTRAFSKRVTPINFLSCLLSDELTRRGDRLLKRRAKQAEFRDPQTTFDNFDFNSTRTMNRSLVFYLATGAFIAKHASCVCDKSSRLPVTGVGFRVGWIVDSLTDRQFEELAVLVV